MSNLFKIVHWQYVNRMAAKEGYGIVLDPEKCGCAWPTLIVGYTIWKIKGIEPDIEYTAYYSFGELNEPDCMRGWHYENNVTKEIIENIRYAIYLRHKWHMLGNLSLIEILDKLNEYDRAIS